MLFLYDGFTIITTKWLETLGYCGPGEAHDFIKQEWNDRTNRLEIDRRVLLNPHGGNLSDGASQGAGMFREAVLQLQDRGAPDRQIGQPSTALIASGGFFFNCGALILRADGK